MFRIGILINNISDRDSPIECEIDNGFRLKTQETVSPDHIRDFFIPGLKMFTDGTLQGSTTLKRTHSSLSMNTGELYLGRYVHDDDDNYGIFTLDQILIWNSALSDAEVANVPN